MFEKEAEEYTKQRAKVLGINDLNLAYHAMQRAYQYGAEFGYNKAKEEMIQNGLALQSDMNKTIEQNIALKKELNKANEWHYVKDELPPEHIPLNILTLDKDKKKRLWTGEYKGGNGEYWTGYFNHFIDKPYAWKEIVLPEEIKEKC